MRRTRTRKTNRSRRGFTLIEMMAVIVIIGLIAGVAALSIPRLIDKARVGSARAEISTLDNALDMFKMDVGRYPTEDEGLEGLVAAPPGLDTWDGPYLKKQEVPLDPWHNPYHYYVRNSESGVECIVVSFGSDGAKGGTNYAADIVSRDVNPDNFTGGM